ncbi:MAG: aminodeoxychorismate/anthranilate synthase component II [Armatimonadota bacterium]|nr:aminodeoxychorismate/anthranilate synthase component II [Armatimonadota bacterium]MDR7451033.1 aminodeoxychorismate/anthranilate synthase component II [Armatimonadota bacterium]MDR7465946.1 aminodeoxychorismate/anthranilate synthase component II [Armatimonadota bacterium]MDR7494011.1 aminodeoxychorismate/anthranilate synthase component II [Armatimonadota bacterium]MDR7498461.1 aminodeoxychorismate/anthranilate synthase component II [Armatimonadota bacterium]
MIIVIDNYDSFTYNLVQYLGEMAGEIRVFRNDQVRPGEVARLRPQAVVISPGPCTPAEAGVSVPLIRALAGTVPILGVCLGHQAIGAAFGGQVVRAPVPVHGKVSEVRHDGQTIFRGLPNPLWGTRYHSLVIERASLPGVLEVSAELADGTIMGVRHREVLVEGVQFHPESVLTTPGRQLLRNFLELAGVPPVAPSRRS